MRYSFLIPRLIISLLNCPVFRTAGFHLPNSSFLRSIFVLGLFIAVHAESIADTPDEVQLIRAWKLDDFSTTKQGVEIDTMINSFQIYNPVFRQSISSSWLGNAGLASVSNYFPDRGPYSDFFFIDNFNLYLRHPSETEYYNTRRPFSLVDFSTGGPRGKNEKMLRVLHTQNVNPDFNVGFRYFNINSDGQYLNQDAVTNAISLFSSYEQDNYEIHANINLNSVRVLENGGLADPSTLYNPNFDTEDHRIRFQDGGNNPLAVRNGLRNNSFFVSQSWQPLLYSGTDTIAADRPPWFQRFRIYHILQFDQNKRTYIDNNPQQDLYPNFFINTNNTFDSLYYRSFSNTLMLQLPEFEGRLVRFGAKGGIRNELIRGSHNIPPEVVYHFSGPVSEPPYYLLAEPIDSTVTDRRQYRHGSSALVASARGGIGDVFGIWGEAGYFFQGYKSGEYDFRAGISFDLLDGKNRSIIEAAIKQKETTPSLFLQSFHSNHFAWTNDFSRVGESGLSGTISMPQRGLKASVNFDLINNFIYFDHTANPAQYSDIFPVISVSAGKDLRLWRFYFRNKVNYQISGRQEILPLPDISIYQSTWFEQTLIPGTLNMQIGFDAWYSTAYYGYAYQPAISQFYLQSERKIENYPYLDFFINFKHKRARVFFKAEHLNTGWMDPEYFSALKYPRNERMFKLGLSWSFYN
jgi:hypothetical protein